MGWARRFGTAWVGAAFAGAVALIPVQQAVPALGLTHGGPIVAFNGANQSINWSGYSQNAAGRGTQFHSVTGDWVVPTATPHRGGESEFSATWVGIGGGCLDSGCSQTDRTLIQAGTEQDVNYDLLGGTTTNYFAWYELIPSSQTQVALPVAPGDQIHLDIHENGIGSENWSIAIDDLTSGNSYSITVDYQSSYATAEWIEESPAVVAFSIPPTLGSAPLPDLGTVHFDLATANGTNANLVPSQEVQMTDTSGNAEATPSAPDTEADGFDDCSYSASCPASTGGTSPPPPPGLIGGLGGLLVGQGGGLLGPLADLLTGFSGI
jgi:peptidase A4-like protein